MALLRLLSTPLAAVRRNLIWFLLGTYVVAALFPDLGTSLAHRSQGLLPFSGESLRVTHLLLGVLLFCVGVAIRSDEARNLWRFSRSVSLGLVGSWFLPPLALAFLTLAGSLLLEGSAWEAFLIGSILVVAMPSANSSSIWSELSGGQAATTVSVITLGTLITPLATPLVVAVFTKLFGTVGMQIPLSTASLLEVLFAFVMLPAALGIVIRSLLDAAVPRGVALLMDLARGVSMVALLALNYINAAVALPQLVSGSSLAAAGSVAVMAVGFCAVVFAFATWIGRQLRTQPVGNQLAFVYVTAMKNTGAALVLAVSMFPDRPQIALVPVLYTLTQHFAAALLDRVTIGPRRTSTAASAPLTSTLAQTSTPSY